MDFNAVIKRQTTIVAISVAVMVIIVIGTSYAMFLKVADANEKQVIQSGTLSIQLVNGTGDVFPASPVPVEDSEGLKTEGYSFSVSNAGTLDQVYFIALYDPDITTASTVAEKAKKLPFSNIKVSVNSGTPVILANCEQTTFEKDGKTYTAYILEKGVELPSKSSSGSSNSNYKTYNIKMWIDDDTSESMIGKEISLKIYAYGEVNEKTETQAPSSTTTE